MSESGIDVGDEERLEQVGDVEVDPDLAEEVGPTPVPVTAEQLAAGRDAEPVAAADQEQSHELAEQSHDDAGPDQEHPE